MVGSALAQEGVSGVSSYISGKLEENASRAHTVARLEMALSQLEFALERAGKLPITYVSLLRRMKMLKRAYLQGTDLLSKHKKLLVAAEEDQDVGRRRSLPFLDGVSSLLGMLRSNDNDDERLTSSVAKTFEWYAACADKLVADVVESSSPLRRDHHDAFRRYPLLRHLLEGKTLRYETSSKRRGRQEHHRSLCIIWPVRLEERGVEARLLYQYMDRERPERRFRLRLMLRLSEDTDIVGVAVKCLRALAAQFKLATASSSAAGELALLPHRLQDDNDDTTHSSYWPPLDWSEESYVAQTKSWRPDPICCCATGSVVSPPHGVPEPVIAVGFGCYVSAPEYNDVLAAAGSGSSSSSSSSPAAVVVAGGRNAAAPPPLYLVAAFVPHHHLACATMRGIVLTYGGREECLGGGDSVQHVKEVLRSKAIVDCVVGQTEPVDYDRGLRRRPDKSNSNLYPNFLGSNVGWSQCGAAVNWSSTTSCPLVASLFFPKSTPQFHAQTLATAAQPRSAAADHFRAMALPTELVDDVTAEILLRLPPDEPEHLFRASLVCKPWLRLLSDPVFLRRYCAFHGAPPLLGVLHRLQVFDGAPKPCFTPTTSVPAFPHPGSDGRRTQALDCRHGRILIHMLDDENVDLLVWDPVTGDRHCLSEPDIHWMAYSPPRCSAPPRAATTSTATAAPSVWLSWALTETPWMAYGLAYTPQRQEHGASRRILTMPRRGTLIGDEIYFTVSKSRAIVKYDWRKNCLSPCNPQPPETYKGWVTLMEMEDSLGLAGIEDSRLYLWRRKVNVEGAAEWVQCRVIELESLIPMAGNGNIAYVVGFAEDVGTIFIKTSAGLFTIKLETGHVRKVDEPGVYFSVLPYMSFYTPESKGNMSTCDAVV
ncbi:hypothetical protein EJB05_14315, partial [Eragrostis curvula]